VSRNVIPEEFHSAPEKLTTFALGKSADTIWAGAAALCWSANFGPLVGAPLTVLTILIGVLWLQAKA
jgi:hypothetical protein